MKANRVIWNIAFAAMVVGVAAGSALFLTGLFNWDLFVRIMSP